MSVDTAGVAGTTTARRTVPLTVVAAAALAVSGVLALVSAGTHVPGAAAPHHGTFASHNPWWGDTLFLAAVGLTQLITAWALWTRPRTTAMLTGIGVNVLALAVYVVTRASGLPLGPHAGIPEPVGLADLTVAALDVAAVVALVACLPPRSRRMATDVLLLVAAALLVGRVTGALTT